MIEPKLSTVTKLTKLLATASKLPLFTPAVGHTYYPPVAKTASAGIKDSTSTIGLSKEGSPIAGENGLATKTTTIAATTGGKDMSRSSSVVPSIMSKTQRSAGTESRALLRQTIQLAERYGNEYIDTTPLQGEPGSFVLKKINAATASNPGTAKSLTAPRADTNTAAAAPTLAASRPGAPSITPIQTDLTDDEPKRKASSVDRVATAGATLTPITPGGSSKKRKKSKVGGVSGGKITPTQTPSAVV